MFSNNLVDVETIIQSSFIVQDNSKLVTVWAINSYDINFKDMDYWNVALFIIFTGLMSATSTRLEIFP